jgi:hypothetical protein
MDNQSLFRRSRARLALWYTGVMAVILGLSALASIARWCWPTGSP